MSVTSLINEKRNAFGEAVRGTKPPRSKFKTLSGKTAFSKREYADVVPYRTYSADAGGKTVDFPYHLYDAEYRSIVGMAFDYLARFIVAQTGCDASAHVLNRICAEAGLETALRLFPNSAAKVQKDFDASMEAVKQFINTPKAEIDLIAKAACFFARLDPLARGIYQPENEDALFREYSEGTLGDVIELGSLFKATIIESGEINPDSFAIYNPHFGFASMRAGGADADLYVDGTLYDLKTSKDCGYAGNDVPQLWAYYLLALIAQEDDDETSDFYDERIGEFHSIERIALYHARFGEVEYVNIDDLDKQEIEEAKQGVRAYFESGKRWSE